LNRDFFVVIFLEIKNLFIFESYMQYFSKLCKNEI
jgi:hypothetical protein